MIAFPRSRSASLRLLSAGVAWWTLVAVTIACGLRPGWLVAAAAFAPGALLTLQGRRGLSGHPVFSAVEIRILPEPLALGGAVRIELSCRTAGLLAIDRLAVHLRCHERAVLRDGARELPFVKKVFEKSALLAEGLRAEPDTQLVFQAQLRVPTDRCPTFASANCAVDWSVALEVEANHWPSAFRSWVVRVAPVLAS